MLRFYPPDVWRGTDSAQSTLSRVKPYDRSYFDAWYRNPRTRVSRPADLSRRVAMVMGIAEAILGREIRTVLDVGCGEGRWRAPLLRMRPRVEYTGLETSDYAVRRFGRQRDIRKGSFGDLADHSGARFDLVLCVDVLHYLSAREISRGLRALPEVVEGIAYLDVTVLEDAPAGDLDGWIDRPARWYAARFRRAGLVHAGMMCWVPELQAGRLAALEIA